MKFAFITLDFRRFPLEYCFKMARDYGMDGVELWGGRPHAWPLDVDDALAREMRTYKKRYGIEIPMYTPATLGSPYNLCVTEKRVREDAMAFFRRAIEAAERLEIPKMLVTADHPGYAARVCDARACFLENLQLLAAFAAARGVVLVLEALTPMESPVITTVDDCAEVLAAVDAENVEAMLDVVPPVVAYEPVSAYFEKLGAKMNYIHICNSDGKTDAHLRLEDGVLPVRDMFRVFQNHAYEGYVTTELYSENFSDPELYLANAMRIVNGIRAELGI